MEHALPIALMLLIGGPGLLGCGRETHQGEVDAGDAGGESSTGSISVWDCFDGPVYHTSSLEEEVDGSWDPCGPHWTFHYLPVDSLELVEAPATHEAAIVRMALTVTLPDSCWQLSSVIIRDTITHPRVKLVGVRAFHHEQTKCDPTPRTERRFVSLSPDHGTGLGEEGCWVVIDMISGKRKSFDVFSCNAVADDCECSETWPSSGLPLGSDCTAACQCSPALGCLPVSAEKRECGRPCTIDDDCWYGICPAASDAGPAICTIRLEDECEADEDCPVAFICKEYEGVGSCIPNHDMYQDFRHECACDGQCEGPGLVCTLETWPGGRGAGYCNLPCRSLHYNCPEPTSCRYSIKPTSPVCEWIGD